MSQPTNYYDRKVTRRIGSSDAHGQAALLLVESMLHGLLDKGFLRNDEAIKIVSYAIDANEQISADLDESAALGAQSVALLTRIAASLELDQPDNGTGRL